ncbi:MAG: type VI secretion system tip protein VgrG [Planctomycetes bacterium]|nr:type VI secretion system tip protein VgrG [Planctomycetota bacterium]
MPLVRDMSQAQLAFTVAGGADDQFSVTRFRGTEGLCQLYRFEIEMVTAFDIGDFSTIVGKAAVLTVHCVHGARYFHGVVSRLELIGERPGPSGGASHAYRAELVPQLWLLTHRYNSRIFQNKTTSDIISTVLKYGGIASDRIQIAKGAGGTTREYCVQYRETDFNFICRLMEEEGIWWTFEQTKESHTLVIADSVGAYQPIEGESAALSYRPPTGLNAQEEHVFRFRISQSVRPGAVVINDFNFEKPRLALEAKADAGRRESGIQRLSGRIRGAIARDPDRQASGGGIRVGAHSGHRSEQLRPFGAGASV